MNPRQLDGGSKELASIILYNLQSAFPGVEFLLDALDQAEFEVQWNHKAPGAPGEKDLRVFMAVHWPSIDVKLRSSEGQTVGSRTGGSTEMAASLAALASRKRESQKTCSACGRACRRAARVCTQCGVLFPACVECNTLLEEGEKYCSKCGLMVAPAAAAVVDPDFFPAPLKVLYSAISAIDDEQHARKFFDEMVRHTPPEPDAKEKLPLDRPGRSSVDIVCTFLGLCFKAGMTPERVSMWRSAAFGRNQTRKASCRHSTRQRPLFMRLSSRPEKKLVKKTRIYGIAMQSHHRCKH